MNRVLLTFFLAVSAFGAEPSSPFDSPVTGFSVALVPLLTSFEQASVKTTLRGFIARGDSFPGYRQSETEPSEYGLYLNVAVSEDIKEFADRTEQKDGLTHRLIQIPAPTPGQQSLVIELRYGPQVPQETIRAMDDCISRIAKPTKRKPTPK
ncbi:MAG: hypothetical protein ABMA13_05495 [Chthoniobacteraceae bacterium]